MISRLKEIFDLLNPEGQSLNDDENFLKEHINLINLIPNTDFFESDD
jgi:hypothetical protein